MKKTFVLCVMLCLLLSQAFAEKSKFGMNLGLKRAVYREAPISEDFSSGGNDLIGGIGLSLKVPIGYGFSVLCEAQYNTIGYYTRKSTGEKAEVQTHPLSIGLRKDFEWWHLGMGVNLPIWSAKIAGTNYAVTGVPFYHLFAGLNHFLIPNLDLVLKYSANCGHTDARGNMSVVGGSIEGTYWLREFDFIPAFYKPPQKG